jgi:uridine kinase
VKVYPAQFLLVEGRLLFYFEKIRSHFNFSIYLDTDLDILLSRRLYKSLMINTPIEDVVSRYLRFVKPAHEKYVDAVFLGINSVQRPRQHLFDQLQRPAHE